MTVTCIPEHQFSLEVTLDESSAEVVRRLLAPKVGPPGQVIDFTEIMNRCPCLLTKYFGFAPLNGVGYVVNSDQYIVHLDIAQQQFWVTEKTPHG